MDDVTKEKTRAWLMLLVRLLKSQQGQVSQLSGQIATLAEAVRGLDPTFDDVWKQKEAIVEDALIPLRDAQIAQYDELLRLIESGELF
jgi:hypothetical protein